MSKKVANKEDWVFVTGGSRGIGKGLVKALAAEGYFVIFTYNTSSEDAASLVEEIKDSGGRAEGYQCDGSQFDNVEKLCNSLIEKHAQPYALINNMGITADELIYNLDVDRYHSVIASNLNSAIYFNKCLVPSMMEEKRGKVIHMSSVTAFKGNKGQVSYAATKAAMIGITKTLAIEVARFNITINAIAPGFIATEMVEKISDQIKKKITKNIPLKRMGEVNEVAALVNFLISENANYITGQTFVIDGGMSV